MAYYGGKKCDDDVLFRKKKRNNVCLFVCLCFHKLKKRPFLPFLDKKKIQTVFYNTYSFIYEKIFTMLNEINNIYII